MRRGDTKSRRRIRNGAHKHGRAVPSPAFAWMTIYSMRSSMTEGRNDNQASGLSDLLENWVWFEPIRATSTMAVPVAGNAVRENDQIGPGPDVEPPLR